LFKATERTEHSIISLPCISFRSSAFKQVRSEDSSCAVSVQCEPTYAVDELATE
jgi:hypothetical protein